MSIARANRRFTIAVQLADFTRGSLGIAVDAFMLRLTGSNTRVGLMEGFSGIGSLFVGAGAGILADRIGRCVLLRAASVASLARAAALCVTVLLQPTTSVAIVCYLLYGAGLLEGLLMGFQVAPLEALFADSTPASDRARYFALKGAASNVGMAAGPAVAVAIFLARSDTWTLPELSAVILAAVVLGVGEAALLVCLRDVPAGVVSSTSDGGVASHGAGNPDADTPGSVNSARAVDGDVADASVATTGCSASIWIATLIAAQDVLTGLGSGMCYKFQPLFLWKEVGLSPIATNAIMASFQLAAAVGQILITRLAHRVGGPAAAIMFRAGGIGGLAVVIFCRQRAVVVSALLVRGALMNAIDGLTKAILNEHISEAHRARWNIFSLLSATGWSGSAFAGGALADSIGYRERDASGFEPASPSEAS